MGEDRTRAKWDDGQDERLNVAQAAQRLGITKEAVRKRISRGTLRSDKGPDGTVHVYVPPYGTPSGTTSGFATGLGDRDLLYQELRDRLRYIEGQLEAERQAHAEARRLLMAALERIPPQIEAPQEARESPQTVEEGLERAEPRSDASGAQEGVQPRSWWRRMLGG